MSDKEEKLFLELIAKNVWKARREGAILGVVYAVLITALFIMAPATPGPTMGFPMLFYAACMVLLFDFWRRVFKKP